MTREPQPLVPRAGDFLFLDFDGVICDSLDECFYSSAIAWYREFMGMPVPDFSESYMREYRTQRPFVRNGEDYLLIHDSLSRGKRSASQKEYDRLREEAGSGKLEEFFRLFTETRRALIASGRERWISLNPIYPFLLPYMAFLGADPGAFILSTKKKEFIIEILAARQIPWDAERIVSVPQSPKCETISKLLGEHGGHGALFVDDQIEHLVFCPDNRITRYLALWGYAAGNARDSGVIPIDAEKGAALIQAFIDRNG